MSALANSAKLGTVTKVAKNIHLSQSESSPILLVKMVALQIVNNLQSFVFYFNLPTHIIFNTYFCQILIWL